MMLALKNMNRSAKLGLGFALLAMVSSPLHAQSGSRYAYCQQRASEFSGYYGPVPDRHLPGGMFDGAAKGAARGAVGSFIFGGNKKERRRAAKRGAILGGLGAAIKRGAAKKKIKKSARVYRHEMDACMSAGRSGGY